jgi:methionyl-tRNA synthetase
MAASETYLVTSALPYANGDLHLGHIVEAVQTDIFVRFQKLLGNRAVYVCADDTHGTPIELSALRRKITPEALVAEAWEHHHRDYLKYGIQFDIFHTTNSQENRRYANLIFEALNTKGLVEQREIHQYYCEHDKRFLPDRFIVGTCPKCHTANQYGDVCESCGATYDPTDLAEPQCIICKKAPVLKASTHFFVKLAERADFLRAFLETPGMLQDDMRNFIGRWVEEGLHEWCISRDGPYFGFEIPGHPGKYFYVWLDAPIGYLSSTDKWCADTGKNIADYWDPASSTKVVHFIGKDIVYFHALFWPVMLDAAAFKLPSRIIVHGFLTVQGEKMSKSRGTFILASDYAQKVKHPQATEYLRFYFAAKLSSSSGDIDLSIDEIINRVNTMLVNNIGNLHHRTFIFIDRYFESKIPDEAWDAAIAEAVTKTVAEVKAHFEVVEYKEALEKIQALGNLGNKYYQDSKPWELLKSDVPAAAVVMTTCANLVRTLGVLLKPILPAIVSTLETQYGREFCWDDALFSLRGTPVGTTEKLVTPLVQEDFSDLIPPAAVPVIVASAKESKKAASKKAHGTAKPASSDPVTIDDFRKINLRVGIVKEAVPVENADKLLHLSVDDGERIRSIVAGIARSYAPADIIGRRIVFVANLTPATIRGHLSEGMILAADNGKGLSLIAPDADALPGAIVA